MKKKFTGSLCIVMCVMLVLSMFAACSVKDKNTDLTLSSTLAPNDTWTPGVDYVYEPVVISKVELVDLVKDALGDEIADDWNGDLNTLTPEQLEKVEQHAANEGLTIEKDDSGNTVIKKDEIVTTEASQDEINQLMTKASVKDPSNISDEEYNRLSQVAQSEGLIIATRPRVTNVQSDSKTEPDDEEETTKKNDIVIVKPVTTIRQIPVTKAPAPSQNKVNTTKAQNTTKVQTTQAKPLPTTKPVPRTTSVYKPVTTPGTVAPMAPITTGIPASTRDWTVTFKKASNEVFVDSAATNDGGVVAVGITYASVSDNIDDGGVASGLVAKFNKNGKLEWSKVIGSTETTQLESVAILSDGSIAAAGYTVASDLEGAGEYKCPGTIEGIVVRLNKNGDLLGNIRIYGGSADDMLYAIAATNDGGYVIGGKSESVDGDMDGLNTPNKRKSFVYKCNQNGAIEWRSVLNSTKGLLVHDIAVNDAGSVYATVESVGVAYYGDTLINGSDQSVSKSTIVLKLTPTGSLEWYKTIYGTGMTALHSVEISTDGGCVVAGQYTAGRYGNNMGTFEGMYNAGNTGTADGMLVKLNPNGQNGEGVIGWTCPLAGFESEMITGITKINGGFAVSGYTASTNRDFAMMPGTGDYDAFVYIITDLAAKRDIYIFDGSGADNARAVCSNGESIFVAGSTNSGDAMFAECSAKGTKDSAVGFVGCLTFND